MQALNTTRAGPGSRADRARTALDVLDTRLSFYNKPPGEEMTLDTFEEFALGRLEVLRAIENARARGVKGDDLTSYIMGVLDEHLPLRSEEDVRRDCASHFILRLAFSRTDELRRWFLSLESQLFRIRFEREGVRGVQVFMDRERLEYQEVDRDELSDVEPELSAVNAIVAPRTQLQSAFFKIPFEEAMQLVASRRTLLRDGFAYVPRDQMVSIIVERFRANLNEGLDMAYKILPLALKDARIAPLLTHMSKQGTANQYSGTRARSGHVTPAMVDQLARESFPLCMRHMHAKLREHHHLRYEARAQYGLFLKGIGLSLEDAMTFWRNEFTKTKTPEQFDKQYAYNIRHLYGKEGKRTDYTPRSCVTIIMGTAPGANEHHGCPFKHFDEGHLRARLGRAGVGAADVDGLVQLVKAGDYQIACRRHWELVHPGGSAERVGNHPNAWYDESRKFFEERAKPEGEGGAGEGAGEGSGATAAAAEGASGAGSASSGGGATAATAATAATGGMDVEDEA